MKLENIIQKTGVIDESMSIREGFDECVRNNVPGVPFVDSQGHVTGSFSIRETLLSTCVPNIVVQYADILGDDMGPLKIQEEHARKVLELQAKDFVDRQIVTITSDAAVCKAVALMEKNRVNYLFVIDQGKYIGVVTIDGIANRMLQLGRLNNGQAAGDPLR